VQKDLLRRLCLVYINWIMRGGLGVECPERGVHAVGEYFLH
jgi:hypothetical protein